MTSFPGVSFPPSIIGRLAGVDRRHHGDRGTCEPWHAARSTMTSLPGAGLARRQLPRCRSSADWPASIVTTGTAARASRGDRGTMTSLPALALPAVSFPPSIIRTTGRAARHVGTVGTAAR